MIKKIITIEIKFGSHYQEEWYGSLFSIFVEAVANYIRTRHKKNIVTIITKEAK